jgi:hypothetical protein
VIAFSGDPFDADCTSLQDLSFMSTSMEDIPGVWVSAEHQCTMWCNQLASKIAGALLDEAGYIRIHTQSNATSFSDISQGSVDRILRTWWNHDVPVALLEGSNENRSESAADDQMAVKDSDHHILPWINSSHVVGEGTWYSRIEPTPEQGFAFIFERLTYKCPINVLKVLCAT